MTKPMRLQIADAQESPVSGCTCYAHSYFECGCVDATWPETYTHAAAQELRLTHEEIEALRQAVAKLHAAKGRYHTQLAAAELFELCGLPAEKVKT